ncbi:MAG: PilZ domain-containing protein, partial [Deltaproteobacteria bacterium]
QEGQGAGEQGLLTAMAANDPGDSLKDRRASVRLPVEFAVSLTDHETRWDAQGREFCPEGCAVLTDAPLAAGDEIRVELAPAWGAGPLELDGRVAHATRGLLGIAFDVSKPELLETTIDRYDRLQIVDPNLGLLAGRSLRTLPWRLVLHPTGSAATLSPSERRLLSFFDGRRSLDDVRSSLGAEWGSHAHLAIALLHRGALRVGQAQPARAAPVARANVRSAQAEKYFQYALQMKESGDRRQARLNAQLAAGLAPGDLEIARLLDELDAA